VNKSKKIRIKFILIFLHSHTLVGFGEESPHFRHSGDLNNNTRTDKLEYIASNQIASTISIVCSVPIENIPTHTVYVEDDDTTTKADDLSSFSIPVAISGVVVHLSAHPRFTKRRCLVQDWATKVPLEKYMWSPVVFGRIGTLRYSTTGTVKPHPRNFSKKQRRQPKVEHWQPDILLNTVYAITVDGELVTENKYCRYSAGIHWYLFTEFNLDGELVVYVQDASGLGTLVRRILHHNSNELVKTMTVLTRSAQCVKDTCRVLKCPNCVISVEECYHKVFLSEEKMHHCEGFVFRETVLDRSKIDCRESNIVVTTHVASIIENNQNLYATEQALARNPGAVAASIAEAQGIVIERARLRDVVNSAFIECLPFAMLTDPRRPTDPISTIFSDYLRYKRRGGYGGQRVVHDDKHALLVKENDNEYMVGTDESSFIKLHSTPLAAVADRSHFIVWLRHSELESVHPVCFVKSTSPHKPTFIYNDDKVFVKCLKYGESIILYSGDFICFTEVNPDMDIHCVGCQFRQGAELFSTIDQVQNALNMLRATRLKKRKRELL
jgi:hypothetical protein